MNPEILAPAGSMESLNAAIAAGADAVYFGLPNFGARAYANNFTLEQTKEIIQRLHLVNMKAYITMNTILYEDEIEQAYEWAYELYKMGADALIIQDLGLIQLLHKRLPDLELHASTQLSVNTPEQIEQLKKLGVKRVVLARECTLEQIQACAETGMEIEIFIHGALCISYSGQCQFSKIRMDRSGNRGQCAQPCRMEYVLEENGKPVSTNGAFLLSPKDLSLIQDVASLKNAGVASLKIEGRMKSQEYVYESVLKTREALEGKKLSQKDMKELKVTFNREYTKGHTFHQTGENLMNAKSSNHQGIEIGKVVSRNKKRVKIKLFDDLALNDGIRFKGEKFSNGLHVNLMYNNKNQRIQQAYRGQIVEVEFDKPVENNSVVLKTIDSVLKKQVKKEIDSSTRQIAASCSVKCQGIGDKLVLAIQEGSNLITVQSEETAQPAQKRPTNEEVLKQQLLKTGNSFVYFDEFHFDLADNIYFSLSAINALKNKAIEQLKAKKLEYNVQPPQTYECRLNPVTLNTLFAQIDHKSQRLSEFENITWLSEWPIENTYSVGTLQETNKDMVSHLSKGTWIQDMNVTNSYALDALLTLGYQGIVISDEMNLEQIQAMSEAFYKRHQFFAPVIARIYQHPRLMILNHCPVNTLLKDSKRKNCALCRQNEYTLKGKDGKRAYLKGDRQCHMRLYDEKPINRISWIPALKEWGIHAYEMIFMHVSSPDEKKLIEKAENLIQPANQ